MLSPPDTEAQWRQLAVDCYHRWNFSHLIGAIDGKHISCKATANTWSDIFHYNGLFSVILLAVVSSDYKFLWIDVSYKWSFFGAHIYNENEFNEGLQNNYIAGFQEPGLLSGDTHDVSYFLVGDDARGLRTYIIKPYANRDMTREQRVFNYRLSRAGRKVENTFGIVTN
ncbi:uncharacterized protein LOC127866479 [Dreissena polymorpha]|uniref:uncharacterized protein LOC127866479 n=1 Tax=Dreissena polymorpha TaxID=45954 RepID=UPI0022645A1E|nr:uncharacterized protein LOC127866479 [Dreissena polymorpha]